VPQRSKLKSAEELWERDRIEETLITVPSNQPICRAFQDGLAKLKVDWFSGIEVSTVEMVQTYVAKGYGIGVTVSVPKMEYHPQVRPLPLDRFDMVTFGVLWQGRRTVLLDALFQNLETTARQLMEGAPPDHLLLK
jgi:DNA-binding transcriptional LysR family regulator